MSENGCSTSAVDEALDRQNFLICLDCDWK